MVAIKQNDRDDLDAEELVSELKEAVVEKANTHNFIAIGVLCIFAAAAIVGVVGATIFGITWLIAYLWNIGIAPFGVPTMTWWQVTAVWILATFVGQIIKVFFQK